MPAPLSIVIPTLDAADTLAATAEALLEGVTSGLIREVVISDGGSTDETLTVARELGAVLVEGEPGRGSQIARGVFASHAPWILVLHADTALTAGWSDEVRRHIHGDTGLAAYFKLRFDVEGFAPTMIAKGANWRSSALGLPFGDQALVISRRLLKQIGGVPEIPLMEDVVLAQRLKGRLVALNAEAITSAERYRRGGWTRRSARNLLTLARFKLGASPEDLSSGYRKR